MKTRTLLIIGTVAALLWFWLRRSASGAVTALAGDSGASDSVLGGVAGGVSSGAGDSSFAPIQEAPAVDTTTEQNDLAGTVTEQGQQAPPQQSLSEAIGTALTNLGAGEGFVQQIENKVETLQQKSGLLGQLEEAGATERQLRRAENRGVGFAERLLRRLTRN